MVSYSPRAAKALSFLKQTYNDVDIFVEDTGNRNMWLFLIRRLLPQSLRLRSVNLLGGKDRVVEACRLDQQSGGRPRLYIIDSDFDRAHGKAKPRLKHLHRIRPYCVENILVQEKAILEIGLSARPTSTEAELRQDFDFDAWWKNIDALVPLFLTYATVQKVDDCIATVGLPVQSLFEQINGVPSISEAKVRQRIRLLLKALRGTISMCAYGQVRRKIKSRLGTDARQIISGKDYLIPLLNIWVAKHFGFKCSHEQLKVHLAKSWDFMGDPYFVRRVASLAA